MQQELKQMRLYEGEKKSGDLNITSNPTFYFRQQLRIQHLQLAFRRKFGKIRPEVER